jgi:hypothetical protein
MRAKYPLGTSRVSRHKAYRLVSYLRLIGWVVAGAALAVGFLALVQLVFHPFGSVLDRAERSLTAADKALKGDAVAGVSLGTFILVAVVAALPLFRKGVHRRQYGLSFWRGLLSSAIFFGTDRLYRFVQGLGALYFSATVALFIAATIILVEIVARAGRMETESETRTELLASIVSGLVFGLLVQLVGHLLRR